MLHLLTAVCTEYSVRLLVGDTLGDDYYEGQRQYDSYYYIDKELARGRVEVCIGGQYTTVCMDEWSHADASVVCSELGFSRNGMLILTLRWSGEGLIHSGIQWLLVYPYMRSGLTLSMH